MWGLGGFFCFVFVFVVVVFVLFLLIFWMLLFCYSFPDALGTSKPIFMLLGVTEVCLSVCVQQILKVAALQRSN